MSELNPCGGEEREEGCVEGEEEGGEEDSGEDDYEDDEDDDEDDEDDDDDEPLTEGEAKMIISIFFHDYYRDRQNKMLALAFDKHAPTLEQVSQMDYDTIVNTFKRSLVMKVINAMMNRVIHLGNWGRKDNPLVRGAIDVKIFQAAYLMIYLPQNVFDKSNTLKLLTDAQIQEYDTLAANVTLAAKEMLPFFYEVVAQMKKNVLWKELANEGGPKLARLLSSYLKNFKTWKTLEEHFLAIEIVHSLRQLLRAERSLENDPTQAEVTEALRAQQIRLKEKLVILAGKAALDKYLKDTEIEEQNKRARIKPVQAVPPSSSSSASSPVTAHTENASLAHLLLLYPTFQMEIDEDTHKESDRKILTTRLVNPFQKDWEEKLTGDLIQQPARTGLIKEMLLHIRDSLQNVAKDRSKKYPDIAGILDVDFILSRICAQAVDVDEIASPIIDIIKSFLEELKDTKCLDRVTVSWRNHLEKKQDGFLKVCNTMKVVLDSVYIVRLATANERIKKTRPVMEQHGKNWEKETYERMFGTGESRLRKTYMWISMTLQDLISSGDSRISLDGIGGVQSREQCMSLMHISLIRIITENRRMCGPACMRQEKSKCAEIYPETLYLDTKSLDMLRAHFFTDVQSAIIITTVCAVVTCKEVTQSDNEWISTTVCEKVMTHPPNSNNADRCVDVIMESMKDVLPEEKIRLVGILIRKHLEWDHPVHKSIIKSFTDQWYDVLQKGPSAQTTLKLPPGAKYIVEGTLQNARDFRKICELSLAVHGDTYDDAIRKAIQRISAKRHSPEEAEAHDPHTAKLQRLGPE